MEKMHVIEKQYLKFVDLQTHNGENKLIQDVLEKINFGFYQLGKINPNHLIKKFFKDTFNFYSKKF